MSPRLVASTLAFLVGFPVLSLAAPMYDFSTLSGPGGSLLNLGTTEAVSGVLGTIDVSGWYLDSSSKPGTWTPTGLIARGESNDHGLGVCSPGENAAACTDGATGGGDDNELSHQLNQEAILLERPSGTTWAGLWVSSLDNNDGAGIESGTVFWGTSSLTGSDLITALLGGSSFAFAYPEFGGTAVEGSLPLPASFDVTAQYVLFIPGNLAIPGQNTTSSSNNDYLVWGADLRQPREGDVPVPEPLTLLLVGSGLPGLAYWRKRFRR